MKKRVAYTDTTDKIITKMTFQEFTYSFHQEGIKIKQETMFSSANYLVAKGTFPIILSLAV